MRIVEGRDSNMGAFRPLDKFVLHPHLEHRFSLLIPLSQRELGEGLGEGAAPASQCVSYATDASETHRV